jgi:hypothetical protein
MSNDCTLRIAWNPIGQVELDSDGKIRFPKLPTKPGIYHFRIRRADGSAGRYIGETDNLQRRFAHYRNPGPTQQTNLRLNALFKALLSEGGNIETSIVTESAWFRKNGVEEPANLSDKNVRRLFENLALVIEKADEIEDLNA